MSIKRYFNLFKLKVDQFLRVGIKNNDSEIIAYAKYFTNSMALVLILIAVVYFIIYFIFYQSIISLIYVAVFVLSLQTFILNYYGYGRLASIFILSLISAIIFFTSLLGGFDMDIYPALVVIALCSASILKSWRLAFLVNVIIFVLYIITRNYSDLTGPLLDKPVVYYRQYLNFGFVVLSAFILSRLIFNTVINFINKQQVALKDAQGYIAKIENQNKRLELFNTIAAHDLKTPTRQVISFSNLAQKKNVKIKDKELEDYLQSIGKAGTRMKALIESISTLNSISLEERNAVVPINLSSIISQIEKTELAARYENVNLVYSNLPNLIFNEKHLYLVFLNLMLNAAKFNKSIEKLIVIKSRSDNENIFLTIEDNGIGIDDKFKELIFEPFKNLHVNDAYRGVGLGLFIVSDILTYYKGSITCSTIKEGGSKFTIKLPIEVLSKL